MADGLMVYDDYVERIHSKKPCGRIYKASDSAPAIPTRYQTVVTDTSDRKGFLSKARRFLYYCDNDIPGPGKYMAHGKFENDSTSFSKKGTGGLASKTKRVINFVNTNAVGSDLLALPSTLNSRTDFNRGGNTSTFHKPIAGKITPEPSPAPNEYKVQTRPGRNNNVSAGAAFKSQSKREMIHMKEESQRPAPSLYYIKDDLLHDSPKIISGVFKSKTKRKFFPNRENIPGPGTYEHTDLASASKRLFSHKHYLCLSSPAIKLPPAPPMPGPGSYEVTDFEGKQKHYMSSSMFVSTTGRWGESAKHGCPGPAHYYPMMPIKQSFNFNGEGRWL